MAVWVYCVLWFLVQDAAKVLTYRLLEYLQADETKRLEDVSKRGAILSMYDDANREARQRGLVSKRAHLGSEEDGVASAQLVAKVKSLEGELALMREALSRAGLLPAAGAGAGAAAAASSHGH